MNCQDFEAIVDDLARGEMMEVSAREGALTHADACLPCARRLATERLLVADLRALAEADELEEAPLRLELPLVAGFRFRGAASPAPQVRQRRRWVKHAALGAVAASVLLIAALLAVRHQPLPHRTAPRPTQHARPTASKPVLAQAAAPSQAAPYAAREIHRAATPSRIRSAARTVEAEDGEVTTDFLPLPYGDALNTLEGSDLVRIRLPRSALRNFGLPVNQYNRGEFVQADVLLGEDGLARAIRFVQ